ncbi:MAG: uroporphyrinogen-III C-methyltransferase [Pirellulales bacterium]|nr:uroporphyrinogen-III C-methyltransferase [Pirellulales bacterium]
MTPPSPTASVYLIGAGPGDPGLLTLRGCELLARADVVCYDYLVDPRVLVHARPDAEQICLGRHGHGRLLTQDEINAALVAAARAGRTVARLKGGDPAIFGRLAEEIAALEAARVPYEVVPGVTAASAATAYAGIPLTHREAASCVAFITGKECRDKQGDLLDLAALAQFPGTLVIYMGVTTAPAWATGLVAHGKSPDTPAAIVRHASLPQQRVEITTLGELPAALVPSRFRPPIVVIVGEAVAARTAASWFSTRPLFGQTVLVTRPAHQADALAERLEALGARVLRQPAITIGPAPDPAAVAATLARLGEFQWLAFSSVNGVERFLAALRAGGRDLRALGGLKLAAIGPATTAALAAHGLIADVQPAEYRAEALAEALAAAAARGERFLLVRASRGREVLAEQLAAASPGPGAVEQVVVYESRDVTTPDSQVAEQLSAGHIDWITVTSSAIARSLAALFGDDLARAKLAAISPLTAAALAESHHAARVVATESTSEGLVAAMLADHPFA